MIFLKKTFSDFRFGMPGSGKCFGSFFIIFLIRTVDFFRFGIIFQWQMKNNICRFSAAHNPTEILLWATTT